MALFEKINPTVKLLIISDFFLFFAVGLLSPIFAVFVLDNIENKIEVIGLAASFYWLTRVIMVVPFSKLMDKLQGETDEYSFMIFGTFLISIVPLLYLISSKPWHIYLAQIIYGFANSMAVPAWRIIFTNHIDRKIIGFEWSLEDVAVGLATATSATLGAFIANRFGFDFLFMTISFFGLFSTLVLLFANREKKGLLKKIFSGKTERSPLKIDTIK